MAMPQEAQGQQQGQEQAVGEAGQAQDPITAMIAGVARALDQLSQVFAQRAPEISDALRQINEQYNQVITAALDKAQGEQGGPRPQQAQQMASPEAGVRSKTQPAM